MKNGVTEDTIHSQFERDPHYICHLVNNRGKPANVWKDDSGEEFKLFHMCPACQTAIQETIQQDFTFQSLGPKEVIKLGESYNHHCKYYMKYKNINENIFPFLKLYSIFDLVKEGRTEIKEDEFKKHFSKQLDIFKLYEDVEKKDGRSQFIIEKEGMKLISKFYLNNLNVLDDTFGISELLYIYNFDFPV